MGYCAIVSDAVIGKLVDWRKRICDKKSKGKLCDGIAKGALKCSPFISSGSSLWCVTSQGRAESRWGVVAVPGQQLRLAG